MERTRLKLAVIFLLAALNVVLLGYVLLQAKQSKDYEDLTRQQIMTYLTDHGIAVSETHIPWDEDWRAVVLEGESNNMGVARLDGLDRSGRNAQVRKAHGKLHEERHGAPGGLHLAVFRQAPLREGIAWNAQG